MEHNAFHVTHISPILRLESSKYSYRKLSDATVYNYSKQASSNASYYIETVYLDARILMQLTQYCVFIRRFYDLQQLINYLMFYFVVIL